MKMYIEATGKSLKDKSCFRTQLFINSTRPKRVKAKGHSGYVFFYVSYI